MAVITSTYACCHVGRFMIHDLQSVCYTFASCQTIPMRAPTYRNSATGGRDVSIVDANNGGRSLPPTRTTCSYLVGTTHKPARWAKKIEMFGPSKGHIASSQIESGSDKVHLCIWDVPPLSLDAKENQHQLL